MASDAFTNTNGTLLSAHTAAGVLWAAIGGRGEAEGEIQDNMASCGAGSNVAVRASNSASDFCQIVFKAGNYAIESKTVHVRAGAATAGYNLQVAEMTGDTITSMYLLRNDAFLCSCPVSLSRLVDHTIALQATTNGSNVELRGYIDGAQITWNRTSSEDDTDSQVFTDLAANGPIASGNPGFSCLFFAGIDAANSAFDDWTDTPSAGGAEVTVTSVTPTNLRVNMIGADIVGTGFGETQGTGMVLIAPSDDVDDVNAIAQTITSWGDTGIEFNVVLGDLDLATNLYLFVVSDAGDSNAAGAVVQILPSLGALAIGAGLLN